MRYNEHVKRKLFSYFIVRQGFHKYHKGWLRGDCPSCGKHNKFGIQLRGNRSNCFVCGHNEKPLNLVASYEGLQTFQEVQEFLAKYDGESFEKYEEEVLSVKTKTSKLELPESYTLLAFAEGEIGKMAKNYVRSRGFKIMDLTYQGVGYCYKGPLAGYLVFPFYRNSELIYYQCRRFWDFGPKFNNPEEEALGIGKTQIIYNHDALLVYKKIWLVESVINVLTIGENAIAGLGKSWSSYQIAEVKKSPCKYVVIALDPDAIKEAIKLAFALFDTKKIKLLIFPPEQDVNSIGKKATKLMEKEAEYLSFGQLLSLKEEYL